VLLAVAAAVFLYRQDIIDRFTVMTFKPTPAVAALAERAQLSGEGDFLYLASRPQLLDREPFNAACHSVATEKTAVLGCYALNRIYVFNIDNQKLDGIQEVTAAHEMLHAAYQRLSEPERQRVDALLEKQMSSLGSNTDRINTLMKEYAKSEPGERLNELHSILGTEVRQLSPALETYYSRYFRNRSALVSLAEKYQAVFDDLRTRQDTLASELNSLADSVEAEVSTYKANLQALNRDIKSFNTRATSGTMSREEYDSQRSSLEARQAKLTSDYNAIQGMINEYNQKRQELAAINTESEALNRSINSSLAPVPEGI
jgi:chromosome segregation ATPase